MANLNIFGRDWADIVFEGRNKSYGAYKLRQDNPKNTMMALILGVALMGTAFGSKYIFDGIFGEKSTKEADTDTVTLVDIMPQDITPPEPQVIEEPEPIPEPEQADAAKSVQDEVEFKETVVKKDNEVKNEQKTAQEKFDDNTTSGQQTKEGDKNDGNLKTDGANTGNASKESKGTGQGNVTSTEDPNKVYIAVQQKASKPEGWDQKFVRQFRTPEISGSVNQITIRMQFVVEKDGSLTDIKVLNDQYGVAKEAERVLKTLPKWKPAQQGGKTVRSKFTLPLTVEIN